MGVSRQEYWSGLGLPSPGEALYSQQKQDLELTVAQIMNSLLQNSDKLKKLGKTTRPFPPISKLPQASYPYPSQGRWIFKLHAEYIMRNAMLDEAQAGIKTARRNINNLRYADDTTLMAESKEELKSLLMKVKEKSEKAGLNSTFKKLRSWHPVPPLHGK